MTNLNIAKLYLANNSTATAAQIDTAVTDGTANTAVQALSTAAFVEAAYQAAFGRAADAEGLAYWSNEIDANGMAKDDAFMTALNYGATVYVAPTAENPLVIGGVTFTAATVSATDDVAVAANKATAEAAAAAISVGEAAAIVATVTEVATTVTAASDAVAVVVAANTPDAPDASQTFTLTTGTDTFDGASGDDTINSLAGTLNAADIIFDEASNNDNDTLNVTLNAAGAAATISNIENINVTVDSLIGATASFNAANTFGSNITMVAGAVLDGAASVLTLGTNNLTAGTGISSLTATAIATGVTIDLGSATEVNLDSATATNDITINVNGDSKAAIGSTTAFDVITLNVTADSDLDLINAAAVNSQTGNIIVTGAGNLTLSDAEVLTNDTITNSGTGTVEASIDAAGAVVATGWDVEKITATADMNNNAITVSSGMTLEAAKLQTSMEIASGTALTKDVVTLNTAYNHVTDLTFTNFEEATVNATSGTVTIADLIYSVATAKAILTGAADKVIITDIDAPKLDASAFAGTLVVTEADVLLTDIKSGTGAGTFTLGAVDMSFTGQSGADKIDAQALAANTLSAQLSSGNDTIKMSFATAVAGTIVADGGDGVDTLWVKAATDADAATISIANFEKIEIENQTVSAVDATTAVTLLGSVVSAKTLDITTDEAADTVAVTIEIDKALTDLSNITLTNIDVFNVDAAATAGSVIKGSAGIDLISTAATDIVITGNAGNDIVDFTAIGDSIATSMISMTDYTANADKIDFVGVSTVIADLTSGNTDVAALETSGATLTEEVWAVVSNGMLSLQALNTDDAEFDTLAEMLLVADTVLGNAETVLAFEFSGNTYVVESDSLDAGVLDNVIELTGTTGFTSVSAAAAAADTIFIA